MRRRDHYSETDRLDFEAYFQDLVNEVERLNAGGVECVIVQSPLEQNIQHLSNFEKERIEKWSFDYGHITGEDCAIIKKVYTDDIDLEYLCKVYDGTRVFRKDGIRYLANYRSEYVNIISGERVTCYQPEKFKHSIYVFGQCTVRGIGVEDKDTIPSFLQRRINQEFKDCYRIHNCGIGCGSDVHDELAHLKRKAIRKGDIVIFCTNLELAPDELRERSQIEIFDSSFLFERPHDYGEWFTDETFHTTPKGNKAIAEYIYEILNQRGILEKGKETESGDYIYSGRPNSPYDKTDMEEFLKEIRPYRHEGMKCGGILMSCNPFTKGHLYLIETASKEVDWLYIFVVQENTLFFDFETRLDLVKKGTRHLKNVTVLPSGRAFANAATFPGYFDRENNPDVEVDASLDIVLFGEYIAPELAIRIRFVGEEPLDFVTRQYNMQMQEILPEYGIEVREVKRKELLGKAVSASTVRALLKEKKFDEIEKLVPVTTYDFLMEHYGG